MRSLMFSEQLPMCQAMGRHFTGLIHWILTTAKWDKYSAIIPITHSRKKCSERLSILTKDTQLLSQTSWIVTPVCLMPKHMVICLFVSCHIVSNLFIIVQLLSRYTHVLDIHYHFRKPFQTQNWSHHILKTTVQMLTQGGIQTLQMCVLVAHSSPWSSVWSGHSI